jgi:hypothetical protein
MSSIIAMLNGKLAQKKGEATARDGAATAAVLAEES